MPNVTGTPAATDAITRADGDTRYLNVQKCVSTGTAVSSTNGAFDGTALPGVSFSVEANSTYEFELFCRFTTLASSSILFRIFASGGATFSPTDSASVAVLNIIGSTTVNTSDVASSTIINFLGANASSFTNRSCMSKGFFSTGGAGTIVFSARQWGTAVASGLTILTGAVVILRKVS